MTDEAQRIITTIKQMEISLDDAKSRHEYEAEDEDLKITYPLTRCLQGLKEKHLHISKVHKERFEQVKSTYFLLAAFFQDYSPILFLVLAADFYRTRASP